jgi:hypothetical protein
MNRMIGLAAALVATQVLCGCGALQERREAKRLAKPVAQSICVVDDVKCVGAPFFRRRVAAYLTEAGFRLVEAGCDATVTYTSFNQGQWEILEKSLFGSKSSNNWRAEGIVSLQIAGKVLVEDKRVDLRDYKTMQSLLEELAETIVEVVPDHLRPN